MILYFPMILLATPCHQAKQPDITPKQKKSERTHKGTKRRRAQQ